MKKETSAQLLALSVDTLYQTWKEARADGVVTVEELDRLEYRIGHLRLHSEGHATRIRLGLRLINGGVVDRDMAANVRSYVRWSTAETERLYRLAGTYRGG